MTTLVHCSDIHFGRDADLAQIDALEALVPTLAPTAVVITGDLTQRARHGEFQRALALVRSLERTAPTYVIPGNHDVQWWETPLDLLGSRRKYAKYRRYFGDDLTPSLTLPGLVIESVLSSHGVAWGSLTWKFWRDTAVKGHVTSADLVRVAERFRQAPADALRVLALHHNVLRGDISRRMGLARWRKVQRALGELGVDLVVCGHDHQEGAEALGGVVISTASTHTSRTRGQRPSAFNVIEADRTEIRLIHHAWDAAGGRFIAATPHRFPRQVR